MKSYVRISNVIRLGATMKSYVRIYSLKVAEILVFYGMFVMQKYLTEVWKLSFTHAAGIMNVWGGICKILPVFFLFLVDSLLGNFMMLVLSSIAHTVGIGFVAMSTPQVLANSTGTCKQYEAHCIGHTQKSLFYAGMALIAFGIAGHLISIHPFLHEQDQDYKPNNDKNAKTNILTVQGITLLVLISGIGSILLPFIKLWSVRFAIPAICTVIANIFFLTGWHTYNKIEPQGSPLTNVCRVFVAVVLKISQPFDAKRLYKKDGESFTHTRFLRCLEKAAVTSPAIKLEDQLNHRWRLCSVSEVEDAKIVVRMVPMWLTFIVCGIVSSTSNTYFVEQANHMNRNIGKWKIPIPVHLLLFEGAKIFFDLIASSFLKNSKKYAPPVGIGIAMVFSILCCITAARTEEKRLGVITRHDLVNKPEAKIPMSVFWLIFQFFLLAGLDSFFENSARAFYDDQSPESMRNYLNVFTMGVSGLGYMCSVLLVYVVGRMSEKGGKRNWFQFTLSRSRLDRYYWVLAGLSSVNLVMFMLVALFYRYKNREASDEDPADGGGFGLVNVVRCFC